MPSEWVLIQFDQCLYKREGEDIQRDLRSVHTKKAMYVPSEKIPICKQGERPQVVKDRVFLDRKPNMLIS